MENNLHNERFSIKIAVTDDDIDLYRHVNNIVYVRWIQDVSSAHWNAKATELQKETIGWVVVRHEIDYLHAALMGDDIIGTTWIGATKKSLCERFVEFHRESDQKRIARSRSLWCPIDLCTFKPMRVGEEVYNRFNPVA